MALRKCAICGKQYDTCHTPNVTPGCFRWGDVVCSSGCAVEYFKEQEEKTASTKSATKQKKNASTANDKDEEDKTNS